MPERRRPTVTLAILTLNEIDALKQILPRIDRSLFDQVLVIDGNSTDGTAEWCREQGLEGFTQTSFGLRQAWWTSSRRVTTW